MSHVLIRQREYPPMETLLRELSDRLRDDGRHALANDIESFATLPATSTRAMEVARIIADGLAGRR